MKIKINLIFLSLFVALAMISCSDDDPSSSSGGNSGGTSNRPPEVQIANINTGDTFLSGEAISVQVEASDPDNNLQQVRLYVDDVLTDSHAGGQYTFVVPAGALAAGTHTLRVAAMDQKGETTNAAVTIDYIVNYIKIGEDVTKLGSANCEINYYYQIQPAFYSSRVVRFYDNYGKLSFFIGTHSLARLTTIDTGAWTYTSTWEYSSTCYFMWSLLGKSSERALSWFRVSSQGAGFVVDAQINENTTLHYEGSIPVYTY